MEKANKPLKIALLGAESTGKTELTQQLEAHFKASGKSVGLVPEYLREWCITHARTPRPQEQLSIATEQARRIDEAALNVGGLNIVIADTTPLMIAIYSDLLFDDRSLYDMALAHQRTFDLTLLTGLDLPWVADGLQRDGPHVREPVDALIRAALLRGNINYQVVYGAGTSRLENALTCLGLGKSVAQITQDTTTSNRKLWVCERCSDPDCEHRLFTSLIR